MFIIRSLRVGVAVALLTAAALAEGGLVSEPARPADSLVEGIGVATHFGYRNTVYHQKWDEVHFRAKGLLPATTYPFQVVAAARDGGVSAPTPVAAATVDAFPDLVGRSLKVVPESPKEGDALHFEAVIENIGKAPTEDGVTIGTKFAVDGKTVCWCDNVRGPLAPGQKVTVRSNSGPTGAETWTMTRGAHLITAYIDDVNRIREDGGRPDGEDGE
jgi:hypothetical protein